jgi:Zn-dependent membrane protease YugP
METRPAPAEVPLVTFDPLYLLLVVPAFLLSAWAAARTRAAFAKYSQVPTTQGLTGAQAAGELLARAGIADVAVVPARGILTDHYNPASKRLALSEPVFNSTSVAAVGVASHEAGHAIQHAHRYGPLWLRSALVPTASIGSSLGYMVMLAGLMLASSRAVWIGAFLFSAVIAFQLVTLPVEFDASARAKALLVKHGLVSPGEREGIDRVLNAAALTYVAAAVSSLATLAYFLVRSGALRRQRN